MELKVYTTEGRIVPINFAEHGFGYNIQQGVISINDPWTIAHTQEEKHFLYNLYKNTIKNLNIVKIEIIDGENTYVLNGEMHTYFQILYVPDYVCDAIYFKHI